MPDAQYQVADVSDIETPAGSKPGEAPWRAVRRHFGIGSFGITAYVAEAAGDLLTSEHTEVDDSGTRHEELFYVASGHASIKVGTDTIDAPAGTFVYVGDPAVGRGATALAAGTTLLALGGEPGKAFEVSPWERDYFDGE
jgi:hypothetical protein